MQRLTRAKAIRAKCLDCCYGQSAEVRCCPASNCPLFPYRMGREDTEAYTDIPKGAEAQKTTQNALFFTAERGRRRQDGRE